MQDSVEHLRARWTPELTAAAIRVLKGHPAAVEVPSMDHDGRTYLDLRGIRIEQIQLDAAVIRNANLRWSSIRDVGLKGTQFLECNLSHANFFECYFRDTEFQQCDIVSAKFERSEFSDASIEDCRLDFASFRECEITLQTVRFRDDADPHVQARVCRNLKLNAMSMGHFADAGELTFMEKTYERHQLYRHAFGGQHETLGARIEALRAWLVSVFLSALWGYGEKPRRITLAMAVGILFFGALQYWLDGIPGNGFWAHVYFSGITFLTIGYGDLVPVAALPRALAVIEGVVGITVLGMLIASWTKKIMYR
ncbi:MAG: pentapeptide repeat-containing protein [Betaproteobacteria bacterium]|nr:pentapeptide repeat-containing protein [Betaproteobacteria bacterium]